MSRNNNIAEASQGDLAEIFGVDRTRIHAWQRQGLPVLHGGRGVQNLHPVPVALRWRIGSRVAKGLQLNLGALDTVALGEASMRHQGDSSTLDDVDIVEALTRCGISGAAEYPKRLAYYEGRLSALTEAQ